MRTEDSTTKDAKDTAKAEISTHTKLVARDHGPEARTGQHAVEPVQNGHGKESPRQDSKAGGKQATIIDRDHTGQQKSAPVQTHKGRAHETEAKDTHQGIKSTEQAHEKGHPGRETTVDEKRAGSISEKHTQQQKPHVPQTPSDNGSSQVHGLWAGTSAQSGPSLGSRNGAGGDSPRTKHLTEVGGAAREATNDTGAPVSKVPGADSWQTPKTDPRLIGIVERTYGITGDQDVNAGEVCYPSSTPRIKDENSANTHVMASIGGVEG
ncbi:hypothetical protein IMZ48_24565 [Candidatus Bathyarchaeota archaeon]|nr:hypothetical protein [Candidatus Bathyarchaeota archaeon]